MHYRNKILVTPGSALLKGDKHLEHLYGILIREGYEVLPYSAANVVRYNRQAIWHIHWIDLFHYGKIRSREMKRHSALISCARFLNFLFMVSLCKLCGVSILWTIHNVASHEQPDTIIGNAVTRLLLRFADSVTAVNNHIRREIARLYRFGNIRFLRQGLYDFGRRDTTRQEARHQLGLDEEDFVIVFLGVIEEYKGIDLAMEAMKEFCDDPVKLVVAGRLDRNSAYGHRVLELAEKNSNILLFDGFIHDQDLHLYFKAADYSIYPYRRVDNSGPIYLTLSFGTPTIIRGIGGIPEIVQLNPRVAIILDQADKEEIVRAISKARSTRVDKSEFDIFREKLCWSHLEYEILQVFCALQPNNSRDKPTSAGCVNA
jgi:glycosyltransferase involved in cell wall biosynthesis